MKFRRTPLVLALMLVFQSYCVRADDVVNTQLLKATGAKVAIETADYAINQIQNNNNQNDNEQIDSQKSTQKSSGSLKENSPESTTQSDTTVPKKRSWKFWKKDREQEAKQEALEMVQEKELTPKYPIKVHTEKQEITELLEKHLPIISYQKREEMDDEQISYLVEDTPKDVQNLVRTEGYFNAKTQITPQPERKFPRIHNPK